MIIKRKHTNEIVKRKKKNAKNISKEVKPSNNKTAMLLFKLVKCAKKELSNDAKQINKPLLNTAKEEQINKIGKILRCTKFNNKIKIV